MDCHKNHFYVYPRVDQYVFALIVVVIYVDMHKCVMRLISKYYASRFKTVKDMASGNMKVANYKKWNIVQS